MTSEKSKLIQWFAIFLIVQVGVIHILNAQAEYEEAAYMGYLFAANFFCALIAAYGIYRRQLFGWMVGLFVVLGSMVGYAWSRTLGMPGMEVEEWFSPYGLIAMTLEGIFILLLLLQPWKSLSGTSVPAAGSRLSRFMPATVLLLVLSTSFLAYRWDEAVTLAYGYHVGTLEQVVDTPETSIDDLTQNYGVQVVQAADSMMGSIVDVRIRIIDPQKAHALFQNQAALLVGDQALILAPHMHSHAGTRLQPGKVFIVFFPTRQIIHPGTEISLVFGPVRTHPVIVR